ncbi:GlxA family transcriptional regulator [Amycolatopsis anabasis]|uniref:GlxA family transcriptional regulator n=1 Tax=Amycolatopsis anabasis TaxID=1840409 RepID=UPI00131EBA6E|nr:helix-turn-helix domain-containing protein [Amycolatopsis anabasis]
MHDVVVLASPGAVLFDLTVPWHVFEDGLAGYAPAEGGLDPCYRVRIASRDGEPVRCQCGLHAGVHGDLELLEAADTVIVTGFADVDYPHDEDVLVSLRRAHAAGRRVVGLCDGAFLLAEAGLLDDRRATTHRARASLLARRFPQITVVPDALYVDADDRVFTSGGEAEMIGLCLHLIRADHGADAAAFAERRMAFAEHRGGPVSDDRSLGALREWITQNLDQRLTLSDLAARVHLSERTLTRRFKAEVGVSPRRWILFQRLNLAQNLLERTDQPVEAIARSTGFSCPASLREHFQRAVQMSPARYRVFIRAQRDELETRGSWS